MEIPLSDALLRVLFAFERANDMFLLHPVVVVLPAEEEEYLGLEDTTESGGSNFFLFLFLSV